MQVGTLNTPSSVHFQSFTSGNDLNFRIVTVTLPLMRGFIPSSKFETSLSISRLVLFAVPGKYSANEHRRALDCAATAV